MSQKMSLQARRATASSSRGAGKPYNDHATRKTMTEQRIMSECMTGLRFLQLFPLVLLAHRTQKVLLRVRRTTAGSSRSADKLHPHHATPQATPAHNDLTSVSARPLDVSFLAHHQSIADAKEIGSIMTGPKPPRGVRVFLQPERLFTTRRGFFQPAKVSPEGLFPTGKVLFQPQR